MTRSERLLLLQQLLLLSRGTEWEMRYGCCVALKYSIHGQGARRRQERERNHDDKEEDKEDKEDKEEETMLRAMLLHLLRDVSPS